MSNSLNDFLKGLDPKVLSEGVKMAQEYAKTDEGKKVMEGLKKGEKIGGADKNDILGILRDNPDLAKKLNDLI